MNPQYSAASGSQGPNAQRATPIAQWTPRPPETNRASEWAELTRLRNRTETIWRSADLNHHDI